MWSSALRWRNRITCFLIAAVKHFKLFEWLYDFLSYSGQKQWMTHPSNNILIRWALTGKKNLQRKERKSRCQRFHVITLSSSPARKSSTNTDKETFEITCRSLKDVFALLNWLTSFSRDVWRSFSVYFRSHLLTGRHVVSCTYARPKSVSGILPSAPLSLASKFRR